MCFDGLREYVRVDLLHVWPLFVKEVEFSLELRSMSCFLRLRGVSESVFIPSFPRFEPPRYGMFCYRSGPNLSGDAGAFDVTCCDILLLETAPM